MRRDGHAQPLIELRRASKSTPTLDIALFRLNIEHLACPVVGSETYSTQRTSSWPIR